MYIGYTRQQLEGQKINQDNQKFEDFFPQKFHDSILFPVHHLVRWGVQLDVLLQPCLIWFMDLKPLTFLVGTPSLFNSCQTGHAELVCPWGSSLETQPCQPQRIWKSPAYQLPLSFVLVGGTGLLKYSSLALAGFGGRSPQWSLFKDASLGRASQVGRAGLGQQRKREGFLEALCRAVAPLVL